MTKTATEFVPSGMKSDINDKNEVRYYQATEDGGMEMLNKEPYDDDIVNNVIICDQCGHVEYIPCDMGYHLTHCET